MRKAKTVKKGRCGSRAETLTSTYILLMWVMPYYHILQAKPVCKCVKCTEKMQEIYSSHHLGMSIHIKMYSFM